MAHISAMHRHTAGTIQLSIGEEVQVNCTIQSGPFPSEKLVTLNTVEGPISGFVTIDNVNMINCSVRGNVVSVSGDGVQVKLKGSFFTTARGLASIKKEQLSLTEAS